MLIAIEGIDGTGKTTIAKYIVEELRKRGIDAVYVKEPSDSEWGRRAVSEDLDPEEELVCFIKDREINVSRNVIPALKRGKVVVMDRYYYSTIAYQGARGISVERIRRENERFPKPDIVIILDASPEVALSRVKRRGKFENPEFLKKVREIFLSLKDKNVYVVNAERGLEDVKRDVLNIVMKAFTNFMS